MKIIILLLFLCSTVVYSFPCPNKPEFDNCLDCAINMLGQTRCIEYDDGNDPADGLYVNSVGDKILIVDGVEYITYMGIDLRKVNSSHDKLIISFAGAGPYGEGAPDEADGFFETLVYGDQPSTSSNYGDGIYKLAYNYLDETTVSVIGFPWFVMDGTPQINDDWWGPGPDQLAVRIKEALDKMAPDSKLIIMGKSMGACKMQKAINEMNNLGVSVDLLVLVDASCSLSDQSGETKPILANFKKVFNFRQTLNFPFNDWQNGFSISYSSPTVGHDIIVSIGDNPMCPHRGHNDIDECPDLLKYIDRIVKAELNGDITPILNLLLLD